MALDVHLAALRRFQLTSFNIISCLLRNSRPVCKPQRYLVTAACNHVKVMSHVSERHVTSAYRYTGCCSGEERKDGFRLKAAVWKTAELEEGWIRAAVLQVQVRKRKPCCWSARKQDIRNEFKINQPTRCNNFSSLLLDVYSYVQLNMFRASSRPSSGAQQLQ
jgi:hypothetical protein